LCVAPACLVLLCPMSRCLAFLFRAPPTTKIYTLSLHDALPIYNVVRRAGTARLPVALSQIVVFRCMRQRRGKPDVTPQMRAEMIDRKSTRLNSSHVKISYAVFCLKKKKRRKRRLATPCRATPDQ